MWELIKENFCKRELIASSQKVEAMRAEMVFGFPIETYTEKYDNMDEIKEQTEFVK